MQKYKGHMQKYKGFVWLSAIKKHFDQVWQKNPTKSTQVRKHKFVVVYILFTQKKFSI